MLTELLAGRHINMPERIARGAWPHAPLGFADLVNHLAGIVSHRRWFPQPWRECFSPCDPVADLTVIERRGESRYVVHIRRSGASMNLAEEGERVFADPADAAEFYLRTELHLPGDLDGWRVV